VHINLWASSGALLHEEGPLKENPVDRELLDARVLDHLRSIEGSTAWAMHSGIGATREDVSDACQRLKRQGLVINDGPFWMAVKP
jgi:hypothetical protein